jgi:hypothetical protein
MVKPDTVSPRHFFFVVYRFNRHGRPTRLKLDLIPCLELFGHGCLSICDVASNGP